MVVELPPDRQPAARAGPVRAQHPPGYNLKHSRLSRLILQSPTIRFPHRTSLKVFIKIQFSTEVFINSKGFPARTRLATSSSATRVSSEPFPLCFTLPTTVRRPPTMTPFRTLVLQVTCVLACASAARLPFPAPVYVDEVSSTFIHPFVTFSLTNFYLISSLILLV